MLCKRRGGRNGGGMKRKAVSSPSELEIRIKIKIRQPNASGGGFGADIRPAGLLYFRLL